MATAGPAARGDLPYARGETRPALLETTIGADLARAHPDRGAPVNVSPARRWSYSQLSAADAPAGDRARARWLTGLRENGIL